jgi:chorismate synthase
MSNIWGNNLRLSIFGESHGEGIGIVIDGLPPGHSLDMEEIERSMKKRAPGRGELSTPRKEADNVEILSGIFNGKTTGAPLCGIIRNNDTRSKDYLKNLPRPGTADLTAHIKYKGYNDYRGGGHFSGRITAPLVFAGSIARLFLKTRGIAIGAHIYQIGPHKDATFGHSEAQLNKELLESLGNSFFPLLEESNLNEMKNEILKAAEEGDSVGGKVECAALGHPAGLGSPFFQSLESSIASMIFSIPGVKGIEFGQGFHMAEMKGSEANDQWRMEDDKITSSTNNSGGINGGITNGLPIVFRTAFRPTPSISKEQSTVDIFEGGNKSLSVIGRHDPCIVQRAVVVVESALALCLMDNLMEGGWDL